MAIIVNHPLGRFEFPNDTPVEVINQKIIQAEAEYGEERSALDIVGTQVSRGFTSTARGLEDFLPETVTDFFYAEGAEDAMQEEDLRKEYEARVQEAQSPVTAFGSRLIGDVVDPVGFLLPGQKISKLTKTGSKLLDYVLTGTGAGIIAGGTEPVYEEVGDSRVLNTLFGAGLGAGLGAGARGIERLVRRGDDVIGDAAEEASEARALDDELQSTLETVAEDVTPAPRNIPEELTEAVARVEAQLAQPVPDVPRLGDTQIPLPQAGDPLPRLKLELESIKEGTVTPGELRTMQSLINKNNKQIEAIKASKVDPKSRAAKQNKKTLADLEKKNESYQSRIDKHNAATKADEDLQALNKGNIDKLSTTSRGRLDAISKEVTPTRTTTPLQRAVAPSEAPAPAIQGLQGITPPKVIDASTLGRRGSRRRPIPSAEEQMQALEETLRREQQGSVGAMQVDPLTRTQRRISDTTIERVFQGPAPASQIPGATVKFDSELADELYQRVTQTITNKGSRVRTGRAGRQGLGTQPAMTTEATKEIEKMLQEAGSVEEFLKILDTAQKGNVRLTPAQIVASAPLQRRMDNFIAQAEEDYANAIQQYGTADAIPADLQRDLVERTFESIYLKQIISGSLTRASDELNAQKLVNKLKRREEAVSQLLGTRCY